MSGWGKSYHAQGIMEASAPEFDLFALLDYKDEYRGLVKHDLAAHYLVGPVELNWSVADWRRFFDENPKVVLAKHGLNDEEWRQVSNRIVGAFRSICGADTAGLCAIDEAHISAPQNGSTPENIQNLATTGRGEGASSMWITQRLALLEKTIVTQADETLMGGFMRSQDRDQIGAEYPVDLHNPKAADVGPVQADLVPEDHEDRIEGDVAHAVPPLRKFVDDQGHTVGSEWVYANAEGDVERRDTREMEMESTHFGPEGHPIHDPTYG